MPLKCGVREDSLETLGQTKSRSNQSVLKEINSEYSLGELMLNIKLQCFGYLMWRADSQEKILMLKKVEGRRKSGRQRMRWLAGIINSKDMSLSKFCGMVKDREDWFAVVCRVANIWAQLSDRTAKRAKVNKEPVGSIDLKSYNCDIESPTISAFCFNERWEDDYISMQ